VHLTPLARSWAGRNLGRQSATALRNLDNPQPPRVPGEAPFLIVRLVSRMHIASAPLCPQPARSRRLPAAQLTAVRWAG